MDLKNWKTSDPNFEYFESFNDCYFPWKGHIFFGYDLILNMKPQVLVELGTYKGTSLFSFLQSEKDNNIRLNINAVDTWRGDEHAGKYGDEFLNELKSLIDKYYKEVSPNLLQMTFDEALEKFEDQSVDALHIDGLHTYDAVKHDFESWLPKVKDDGVIFFHDIMIKDKDFGVWKLWDELKENYKDYNFISFYHSCGLGVMSKNKLFDFAKDKEKLKEFEDYYASKAGVHLAPLMRKYIEESLGKIEQQSRDYNDVATKLTNSDNYVKELLERVKFVENEKETQHANDLKEIENKSNEINELREALKNIRSRKSVKILKRLGIRI